MVDEFNDERVGELGRRRLRPLPVNLYIFPEDWNHDRILRHGLTEILQNQKVIMADLSKLKTSVDNLSAKVDALIADTTSQAAVDALQSEVDAAATKIDAVLPPAAPAA